MAHETRRAEVACETIPFDVQLRRYDRGSRKRLRKLAKSSPKLRDIVYGFPGLAYTLANGQGPRQDRAAAMAAIKDGRSLKEAARALNIPFWVRRLPPEAFSEPLGEIPNGANFVRRVGNSIPKDLAQTRQWLQWVLAGHHLCGEEFAIWIARQSLNDRPDLRCARLVPLAAYVWYSRNTSHKAWGFIDRPWQPNLRWSKALEAAREWLTRCLFEYCGAGTGAFGRWSVPQKVGPYRIVPLRTSLELIEEGQIMDNCVGTYSGAVMLGSCLIYSVRKGDKHVATLEVRADNQHQRRPFICQLLGPANRDVSSALNEQVHRWLVRQGAYPLITSPTGTGVPLDASRWNDLWRPYLDETEVSNSDFEPRVLQANLNELSRLV